MSNKEFAQAIKRLTLAGVIVAVEPTKRHWRLTLANGFVYHAAGTPSDYRAVQNMVAAIQRYNRLTAFKASGYTAGTACRSDQTRTTK